MADWRGLACPAFFGNRFFREGVGCLWEKAVFKKFFQEKIWDRKIALSNRIDIVPINVLQIGSVSHVQQLDVFFHAQIIFVLVSGALFSKIFQSFRLSPIFRPFDRLVMLCSLALDYYRQVWQEEVETHWPVRLGKSKFMIRVRSGIVLSFVPATRLCL